MGTTRALRHLVTSCRPTTAPRNLLSLHCRAARALSSSPKAGGAGDSAVYSGGPPSDDYADRPPKFSGADETTGDAHDEHPATPRPPPRPVSTKDSVPPFAPSGKPGSQEFAGDTGGPSFTQKRRWSAAAGEPRRDSRDDATPESEEAAARKVREEDREYYRTHKPSPIAEVEFADTRKPITRATDGDGAARLADVPATVVKDTADDSLARAEAMFREAASRGNPAWPHSRALAKMMARRREGAAVPG